MANITRLYESKTSNDNLFFLPALLGDGKFSYSELVKGMVNFPKFFNQTMYGLSDPGLYDLMVLPETFAEAVERYIKAIKFIQPKGPYRLVGFSFGATLAYGVAKSLEENNEVVSDLHLLDAFPPALYQKLDNASHFKLFNSLLNFLIPVLNNGYYKENIKPFKIKRGEVLSPANQIKAAFTFLKRKVTNERSLGVLYLSERHLEFMLTLQTPQIKSLTCPNIYFTKKDQDYLSIIDDVGLSCFDISYKAYFWNAYFYGLRRNETVLGCEHLGVIAHKYASGNYWQYGNFILPHFNHDIYGPKPVYKIDEKSEEVTLSVYFLSGCMLAMVKQFLLANDISCQPTFFGKHYTDGARKGYYMHSLAVLYCCVSKSKLADICQWLQSKSLTQHKAAANTAPVNLNNETLDKVDKNITHIDLHLGISKQVIDLSFSFNVSISLISLYKTLDSLCVNKTQLISLEGSRLAFFSPLNSLNVRQSIEEETNFIINFVDSALNNHPI